MTTIYDAMYITLVTAFAKQLVIKEIEEELRQELQVTKGTKSSANVNVKTS